MSDLVVVKVGGSLFDLPNLGPRLRCWLNSDASVRPPTPVLLVPGGGPTADAVRTFDQRHNLGEERAHWLALRALQLNAYFLAALLPEAGVREDAAPNDRRLTILDSLAFLRADEERHGTATIPHSWTATSDAVAARVAVTVRARRLILLKSVTIPPDVRDWDEAGRRGIVDAVFASILRTGSSDLEVNAVNLRTWQP